MQMTVSTNEQGAVIVPLKQLLETQEYKMRIIDGELIVYPAHLKLYEVVTKEQLAKAILERASKRKPDPNAIQIPDEALRRENMYD
jgi:hypothetical protein